MENAANSFVKMMTVMVIGLVASTVVWSVVRFCYNVWTGYILKGVL